MADLTPNNREEFWLQGMVDGQTTLEPNKRREYWYKEIVDAIGSGGGGGTGGGALIVHDNDGTLDKTYNEIKTALKSGILVLLVYVDGYGENELCVCAQISKAVPLGGNGFAVGCVDLEIVTTPYTTNIWVYISETENGYPVYADR